MKSRPAHVCTSEQLFNYVLMNAKNILFCFASGFSEVFLLLLCACVCFVVLYFCYSGKYKEIKWCVLVVYWKCIFLWIMLWQWLFS